jgi:hypothetical protein
MKTYTTKGGTPLQLITLKGKDYLPVAQRLVWFTEENPKYVIETQIKNPTTETAAATAVISILDNDRNVVRRASATKTESAGNFGDFIEKAETGAIGRALAMLGYGTQFTADELDEGSRIVDAPQKLVVKGKKTSSVSKAEEEF